MAHYLYIVGKESHFSWKLKSLVISLAKPGMRNNFIGGHCHVLFRLLTMTLDVVRFDKLEWGSLLFAEPDFFREHLVG